MFVLLLLLIARNNVLRTTADTAPAMIDGLKLPPLPQNEWKSLERFARRVATGMRTINFHFSLFLNKRQLSDIKRAH